MSTSEHTNTREVPKPVDGDAPVHVDGDNLNGWLSEEITDESIQDDDDIMQSEIRHLKS